MPSGEIGPNVIPPLPPVFLFFFFNHLSDVHFEASPNLLFFLNFCQTIEERVRRVNQGA